MKDTNCVDVHVIKQDMFCKPNPLVLCYHKCQIISIGGVWSSSSQRGGGGGVFGGGGGG